MAIQSSGLITLQDIEDEFGGTGSISLSEYYRNGGLVTSNNTSVPTSGAISLSNFYGATDQFSFSITSNTQNANIRSMALSAGWDGSSALVANVNSGVYLWSDSISTAGAIISGTFPAGLTLNNSGKIMGRGGNAGAKNGSGVTTITPQNGGPAVSVSSSSVTIINNSGAFIAGGGGGGHGGTGGGNQDNTPRGYGGGGGAGGGHNAGTFGDGGAIGQSGADGYSDSSRDQPHAPGRGGGAGGGGGYSLNATSGSDVATGGGGGRILPGTGGSGAYIGFVIRGSGGSADNAGTTGGGGGWGAAGGNGGGSGGAAISGSVSLTNNGTIYGST